MDWGAVVVPLLGGFGGHQRGHPQSRHRRPHRLHPPWTREAVTANAWSTGTNVSPFKLAPDEVNDRLRQVRQVAQGFVAHAQAFTVAGAQQMRVVDSAVVSACGGDYKKTPANPPPPPTISWRKSPSAERAKATSG